MRRFGFILLIAAILSACALTPDYERPALDVPDKYSPTTEQGNSIANLPWWEVFNDPQLQVLIHIALIENKDLGVALNRVAQSNALLTSTKANQFPFLNFSGAAKRSQTSQILFPSASPQNTRRKSLLVRRGSTSSSAFVLIPALSLSDGGIGNGCL